jgi:hypothetical protein
VSQDVARLAVSLSVAVTSHLPASYERPDFLSVRVNVNVYQGNGLCRTVGTALYRLCAQLIELGDLGVQVVP